MVATGEPKARFFPLPYPSGLHSLIKERSDEKESDFQEQR